MKIGKKSKVKKAQVRKSRMERTQNLKMKKKTRKKMRKKTRKKTKRVKKRVKRDLEILFIKVNKVKMMTMILKMTRVTSVLRIILNLFLPRKGISSKG